MDFRNLFFVLFLKSRRTSTNKNLTHFLHLKISYGQATPGVQILSIACSFWENLAKLYVSAPRVGAPTSGKSWIRHWNSFAP